MAFTADPVVAKIQAIQGQRCAICHVAFIDVKPMKDHCHITNKKRGLLCHHCNALLGFARDDIRTLERAIEYLKFYGKS